MSTSLPSMAEYFSFKGSEPTELPDRFEGFSILELATFGYVGPFVKPDYDPFTHKLSWDSVGDPPWTTVELNEIEKAAYLENYQHSQADYTGFYNSLISSALYQSIRTAAITSTSLVLSISEFISVMSDSKNKRFNKSAFQTCINNILIDYNLIPEETEYLQQLLDDTKLSVLYTIN